MGGETGNVNGSEHCLAGRIDVNCIGKKRATEKKKDVNTVILCSILDNFFQGLQILHNLSFIYSIIHSINIY